jgi:serine/threonine-protein kinase
VSSDRFERLREALAGNYHFERELGQGAFASVFVARDLRHERMVAIKVLRVEQGSELNEIRFLREIRFLANLQHPNILPVHDSGHVEELLYYVMPYVRGDTVRERIRRQRQMAVTDAVRIASEIADALDYAHRQGVIHRDIKPENILLSGQHAILADFGIARAIDSARRGEITRTGQGSPGTPAYMSPEQLLGEREIDSRTDIYSLGCVLYETLTGKPPFEGSGGFVKRFTEPAPSIRLLRPEISRALDQVVAKALGRTPEERFATASEMCDALSEAAPRIRMAATSDVAHAAVPRSDPDNRIAPPGSSATDSSALTSDKTTMRLGLRRRILWTGAVVLLFALAIIRAVGFRSRPSQPTTAPDPSRIAVLDFDDQSPDHSLGYIGSGLAVSLIHELSTVDAIQVLSRNSIKSFRDRGLSLDSLVRVLHVGSLVEGTVQRSNERLRVSVQVVDAPSNTQLEGATIERGMGELFMLEDDLAHQVALLLRRRLGVEVRMREMVAGTTSARARDLVFRADKLRDDAAIDPYSSDAVELANANEALFHADSLLASAEAADPRWVAPVLERGWTALELAHRQNGSARGESFRRATDHAARVLAREPASAAALELRGTVLYWQAVRTDLKDSAFTEKLRRSEADLTRALAIDSSLATAWGTLSLVSIARGNIGQADRDARTALAMDTYLKDAPIILGALYIANLMKGSMTDAWQWCDRAGSDYPRDPRFIDCKLTLLAEDDSRRPDPRLALRLLTNVNQMDPPSHARAAGRPFLPLYREIMTAVVLARAGDSDSARAIARHARSAVGSDSLLSMDLVYDEAYLHLVLGERNDTLRLLSDYLAARPSLRALVSRHPRWRPLWNDPAFIRLVQRPTPA